MTDQVRNIIADADIKFEPEDWDPEGGGDVSATFVLTLRDGGELVHRFSVLFKAALTPDPAAIYGAPQETAREDSLGASRCPLRRHRPKFPYRWRWPAWFPPPQGRDIL